MVIEKKIYLVGGAVRDQLMGIPINDKDYVAVGFCEDEFSHLAKVGKDFPVFLQEDGSELALARTEKKIDSGYNGFITNTQDVTLEEDLSRRDLTINSIAYDETTKRYIDPYNGTKDIQNKLLKHTSIAFCEDPMRVLRIARFRAKLGVEWRIDNSTKELIGTMKDELSFLQADRVYKEVEKAATYKEFYLFFETLGELGVLDKIFPFIGELFIKEKQSFILAMELLKTFYNEPFGLKLSAIYYFILKDITNETEILIDIKLPKRIKSYILFLLIKHNQLLELDNKDLHHIERFFSTCKRDKKLFEDIIFFNKLLVKIQSKHHLNVIAGELNDDVILSICDEISSYSPKVWLESLITKPSTSKISSHIQDYNLQVISKYKQAYKKLFVQSN